MHQRGYGTRYNDTEHNDTQHNITFQIGCYFEGYFECRYAMFRYA
jgi:hypothetical protein